VQQHRLITLFISISHERETPLKSLHFTGTTVPVPVLQGLLRMVVWLTTEYSIF
jgi:hypothetical protein